MSRVIFNNARLLDGDNPPRRANVVVSGKLIETVDDALDTGAGGTGRLRSNAPWGGT